MAELTMKQNDLEVRDSVCLTPLHLAALHRGIQEKPDLRIFLLKDDIAPSDKIEALELAGATMLLHRSDIDSVTEAFGYWQEALDLRVRHGLIQKDLFYHKHCIHWRMVEWNSKEDLQEVINNPLQWREQGILVAQRILGKLSSASTLIAYLWPSVEVYLMQLKGEHRLPKLLDVCWIMLESTRGKDLRDSTMWKMILSLRYLLGWTLRHLESENNPVLDSDVVRVSMELVSQTDRSHLVAHPVFEQNDNIHSILQLVRLLAVLPAEMVSNEALRPLYRLLLNNGCDLEGNNLLLRTCLVVTPAAEKIATVRLLLRVGADPNATDDKGNSALHVVAYWMGKGDSDFPPEIADLLLDSGTHIDRMNASRQTPLDCWKNGNEGGNATPPVWTRKTVPRLACWAARSVSQHRIPWEKKDLPNNLHNFVSTH